jgi:hypothetical protein
MARALVPKAAFLLLLGASCTGPPFFEPARFPPIEGVHEGDTADHVRQVLGKANACENGWWRDGGVRYEEDFQVWFYQGKGRVIFDGSGHVFMSEAVSSPSVSPVSQNPLIGEP